MKKVTEMLPKYHAEYQRIVHLDFFGSNFIPTLFNSLKFIYLRFLLHWEIIGDYHRLAYITID